MGDINFRLQTVRVDESSDQRTKGNIGLPKNAAAFRTVALVDAEGREALRTVKKLIGKATGGTLVFRTQQGRPFAATHILHDGLHPALKALGLPIAGMHAFRRGCNRRWELTGLNGAVLRQQMGHSSAAMTARYTGMIPLEQVHAAFSSVPRRQKVALLENMENEAAA